MALRVQVVPQVLQETQGLQGEQVTLALMERAVQAARLELQVTQVA